jgi:hypothetical protein
MAIRARWVLLSVGFSLMMLALSAGEWRRAYDYRFPQAERLSSYEQADAFLQKFPFSSVPPDRLITGVYILAVKFKSATEVGLTGIVWQEYTEYQYEKIKERGFLLPEEVDIGNLVEPGKLFFKEKRRRYFIGWNFDSTVRQRLNYRTFPLDNQLVRLRLWPKDFNSNLVLYPDLNSYVDPSDGSVFGIDVANIVMGEWRIKETFFSYQIANYGTDWGVFDRIPTEGFPDLTFNILMERRPIAAAVAHIVPLTTVFIIIFGLLLLVTGNEKTASRRGYNTASFISSISAMFFVLMIAHISLRRDFPGSGLIFLETFYLLAYAVILLVAVNAYLFNLDDVPHLKWIQANDSSIPKLLYWPLVTTGVYLISRLSL